MSKQTHNPAPHAGEKESPATPKAGQTPGMGAPPRQSSDDKSAGSPDREPGTRKDGEAMPPAAIDPGADTKGKGIPPLPEPNVEGVGEENGPSAEKSNLTKQGFPR